MTQLTTPPAAVLFDCDGVVVDSELNGRTLDHVYPYL